MEKFNNIIAIVLFFSGIAFIFLVIIAIWAGLNDTLLKLLFTDLIILVLARIMYTEKKTDK